MEKRFLPVESTGKLSGPEIFGGFPNILTGALDWTLPKQSSLKHWAALF